MTDEEIKIHIALGSLKGYIISTPEGEWTFQYEVVYATDIRDAIDLALQRGGWVVAGKYYGKDYDLT